jgi:hypothetical protein
MQAALEFFQRLPIEWENIKDIEDLPAEQIKQAVLKWLDTEQGELADLEKTLLLTSEDQQNHPVLSAAEKAAAFREWTQSHRRGLPLLSDEAISRENMYSDERL